MIDDGIKTDLNTDTLLFAKDGTQQWCQHGAGQSTVRAMPNS